MTASGLDSLTPLAGGGAASRGRELTPMQVAMQMKWPILLFAVSVAALVYGALVTLVQQRYLAEASVMIDARRVQLMGAQEGLLSSQTLDESWTRTQMEVLNSPRLAAKVVETLGLARLRLFQDCRPDGGLLDRLRSRVSGSAAPVTCVASDAVATKVLLNSIMTFSNDRQSYIIKIGANAPDPDLAARIANGYADVYVDWLRDLDRTVAEKADTLLAPYLEQLHARATAANAAVEQYRQAHDLVPVRSGENSQASGQTLRSHTLLEANAALSAAAAQLADKQAQLQQLREVLQSNGNVEAIAPVLASPVVHILLERQADIAARIADMRSRLLGNPPDLIAAKAQLASNEQAIKAEAAKAVTSLSGEVAALAARKATLAGQVASLHESVAGESRDSVALEELQRGAQAENSVYQTMLIRLKQIGAERLVQRGEAQVVVEATKPDFPVYPKKKMMVVGAFLASLGIGTGLAFARAFFSQRFRNAEHVEEETGLPVLGLFPVARKHRAQDVVTDAPLSLEAESVHSVLSQVCGNRAPENRRRGRVVLVTSALPGEGKTSFSVAIGRSSAQSGLSTFILDCDLRRPALQEAILGRNAEEATNADTRSGLRFLRLGRYVANPRGILAWPGLPSLLDELRSQYDLILLDTPPVLAVSDALHLGPLADDVLMLIDWRKTSRPAVVAALRALDRAGMPATGAVLSKVDLQRYARANAGDLPYLKYYRAYHDGSVGQRRLEAA